MGTHPVVDESAATSSDARLRRALEKLVIYEYRVEQLEGELKQVREQDRTTREESHRRAGELRDLRDRLARQQRAEKEAAQRNVRLDDALERANSRLRQLETRNESLEGEVVELRAALPAADGAVEELSSIRGRIGELEQALESALTHLESRAAALNEAQNRIAELETERGRFLDKMVEFQKLRGDLEEDTEVVDLATFIAELRAENLALSQQVTTLSEATPTPAPPPAAEPSEPPAPARPDPELRAEVAEAELRSVSESASFASSTERALFELAAQELRSATASTRRRAALRLAELGNRAGLPALMAALQQEEEPRARCALVEGCARLGTDPRGPRDSSPRSPEVEGLLVALVTDTELGVRLAALDGLSRVPGAEAQRLLERSLSDASASVRRRVATLLGHRGEAGSVAALIPLIDDEDARVRRSAALALGTIGARILHHDSDAGDPAATAALSLARSALRRALTDPDASVRENVTRSLHATGGTAEDA